MIIAHQWPDGVDAAATALFVAAVVAVPALGYVAIVLDIRRYLRTLKRALIVVVNYFPDLPAWAREPTPPCLTALGLTMPCTQQELLAAYRAQVKKLHPDRGGDRRRFHRLQRNFEQAQQYLQNIEAGEIASYE